MGLFNQSIKFGSFFKILFAYIFLSEPSNIDSTLISVIIIIIKFK